MTDLPLDFDTTASWRSIITLAVIVFAGCVLCIAGALLSRQFGAAVGLAIITTILWFIASIGRRVPMGATGRLTATDVETRPVRVLGYAIPVPVGRFPLDRFQEVVVRERVILQRPNTPHPENTGRVILVGRPGTPDIEIMRGSITSATGLASDLGRLLGFEVRYTAAPGNWITRDRMTST